MNYELKIPIGRFCVKLIVYLCRKITNDYEEDCLDTDDHRHNGWLQ